MPKPAASILTLLKENIQKVFVGREETVDLVLTALICGGHVLIEDVPGLGKTTLVRSLARSLGLSFARIQFTPDLTPSDVTGYTLFDMATGERQVHLGSVMHQIVLADEINRTGPKTQSSLLEAMQEGQVTIDGETYPLPRPFLVLPPIFAKYGKYGAAASAPFLVLATQNPVELTGTFPLPEAQLDRFLMRISIGYPERAQELEILDRGMARTRPEDLESVVSAQELFDLQEQYARVRCARPILEYIVRIAEATRRSDQIALGVSPRGSLALLSASRGYALLQGRDYVLPEDVQRLVLPVLLHRIQLESQALFKQQSPRHVLEELVQGIQVPAVS